MRKTEDIAIVFGNLPIRYIINSPIKIVARTRMQAIPKENINLSNIFFTSNQISALVFFVLL